MGGGRTDTIKIRIPKEFQDRLDAITRKGPPKLKFEPWQLKVIHERWDDFTFKGLCAEFHRDGATLHRVRRMLIDAKNKKRSPLDDADYVRLAAEI